MKPAMSNKISQFFAAYPLRRYQQGDIILFADNVVPPVFHIKKGRIAQYDIAENGNKVILNIFRAPSFFPMSNAINNTPNMHFYEAATDVQVRQAPAEDVMEFLRENPEVVMNLLARVYRGTNGMLEKMALLMSGTAGARLLLEVTISAQRFGEVQPDGRYLVHFTESQLAQQTGLARETVSRELQKLKASGKVDLVKRGALVQLG